jgi:hypothetical protein
LVVNRQWRVVVAEVERFDPQPCSICTTSLAVIHVPSHTRPRWTSPNHHEASDAADERP